MSKQIVSKCVACGADNPAGSKFCSTCGKELPAEEHPFRCGACGAQQDEKNKFCSICGTLLQKESSLDTSPSTQEPPPDSPEAFQPTQLYPDPVCPFCGYELCQSHLKSEVNVKSRGYSLTSGCCGMIFLGPLGLLCGLCGMGTDVDTKNETWWICGKCGKEHISQANARKNIGIYTAAAFVCTQITALLLALFGLNWITGGFVICALSCWFGVFSLTKENSGYPLSFFVKQSDINIVGIAAVVTALLVYFMGPSALGAFFTWLENT